MKLFSTPLQISSHRTAIALLSILLIIAVVTMPVSIRPAAYNQHESSSSGADSKGRVSPLHDGEDGQALLGGPDEENNNNNDNNAAALAQSKTQTGFKYSRFILNLYVVFHKELDDSLFEDLKIPDALPEGEHAPVAASDSPPGAAAKVDHGHHPQAARGGGDANKGGGSIVDIVLAGNGPVTFFETNKGLDNKEVNESNPLYRNRLVREWETRGWKVTSSYGNALNEYGAMSTIFHSHYTYKSWRNPSQFKSIHVQDSLGRPKVYRLQNGLDDAFIGVLHSDMRLTNKVINALQRRIERTRDFQANNNNRAASMNSNGRGEVLAGSSIRVASHDRAVKLSKLHQQKQQQLQQLQEKKCCVFYSIQYPMQYLLKKDSPTTEKLLRLYNSHFALKTPVTYDDLTKFAILDAFVIPFTEFNRLVPFLQNLMRNYLLEDQLHKKETRRQALHELEQALALFLGLLGKDGGYKYVMIPLRHEVKG